MKTNKEWDVYNHNYEYDEVKVIAMLHKVLMERNLLSDWENIMKVGHWIYEIYIKQINAKQVLPESWMEIQDNEELGYIQIWFSRTINNFIDFYKKSF